MRPNRPPPARSTTRRAPGVLLPLAGLAACALSGCSLVNWVTNGFEVGPDYVEPEVAVSSQWIDYEDPRVQAEEGDLRRWWTVFHDPVLDSLIEAAYGQNLTLQAAAERIIAARASRAIAAAELLPQTQAVGGGFSYNELSEESANPPLDDNFTSWSVSGIIAWELDFWGKYRRSLEASDAALEAQIADFDDVLVILLSEVASNYILYRTFQERIDALRGNIEAQLGSYKIAVDRFEAGAVPERDVYEAKQILEQTRSLLPDLEAGLREANNALCVLQGIPPRDLSDVLGQETRIPAAAPELALGIPADLVRRRPDVRRAERLVAFESALIGVAKADLYPHFSLFGTLGFEAEHFSHLFRSDSFSASVGPSFSWDIFNYGRIENSVRIQEASFRAQALAYQETVLSAAQEAEDAIYGFLKASEKVLYLQESTAAARSVLDIAYDQFREGVIDYTSVYIFQVALTEQEDLLAAARGDIALNLIRLYRALGGGWEMRLPEAGAES